MWNSNFGLGRSITVAVDGLQLVPSVVGTVAFDCMPAAASGCNTKHCDCPAAVAVECNTTAATSLDSFEAFEVHTFVVVVVAVENSHQQHDTAVDTTVAAGRTGHELVPYYLNDAFEADRWPYEACPSFAAAYRELLYAYET